MPMDTQQVALVAVLPADNLVAALADGAQVPTHSGAGAPLIQQAIVCERDMAPQLENMVREAWPQIQMLDTADWTQMARLLAHAGVPEADQARYLDAWQEGDVILVLPAVPADRRSLLEHALAPHLRAGPLTVGVGGVPGEPHPATPSFAVYNMGRPAADPAQALSPIESIIQPDRPIAPALVPRYADVRAPALVPPEQVFEVTVALMHQAPEIMAQAAPLSVRLGASPVTVILYATAFAVVGPARADLEIYPDRDSGPVRFELRSRPGVTGEQQISLTFLQGTDILGRVVAKVQVGGRAPTVSYTMPVESGGPPGGGRVPPDVVLYVDRVVQDGRDQLHFRYLWPQNDELEIVEAGTVELNNVEPWAQAQYADLSRRAYFLPPPGPPDSPDVQEAVRGAVRALERIGEKLYDQLFPPALKAFYKRCAPWARTVLIYSTEPWIPWEIVKPYGLDLAEVYSDFLCARFQIARWLTSDSSGRVPRLVQVRELCPVIPPSNLAAAVRERDYVTRLPQLWPPMLLCETAPDTTDALLALMEGGEVNLFHIATHAGFDASDPGAAAIQLGADRLTPDDVSGTALLRGLTLAAPFVFVNACHSGRQALALSGMGGWVNKLLQYGCSGFVGTNWEVLDDLAAQFAIAFYEGLRAGRTFGAACQQARLSLRAANPGNSTWLAYVLYAHPLGHLQAAAIPARMN
jgi:hypothetical protein